ncbi:MAG TPA: prevent-host-death protein [Verrucomicrobiae bacterium]|jgi:antitoxin (DNA-binding transcriptional repressor) of toxin-antitoxin stability system
MRTVSIREVHHDFNRILEWIADGEEVAITRRSVTVARLLPAKRKKSKRPKMPDIEARLRKIFGDRVISDKAMKEIWDQNRREF